MAPARRRGSGRAAAAAAAATARQWEVGDLVLAKMKGFPAWPAAITDPEQWGYSAHKKKVLVYFFGTKQIAFCNHVDIEAFTEEKKKALLTRRHGKGADFVRALDEIIDSFDKPQKQKLNDHLTTVNEETASDSGNVDGSSCKSSVSPKSTAQDNAPNEEDNGYKSDEGSPVEVDDHQDLDAVCEVSIGKVSILDELRQTPLGTATVTTWRKRSRDAPSLTCVIQKRTPSLRRSRSSVKVDPVKVESAEATESKEISTTTCLDLDSAEHECAVQRKCSNKSPDASVCPDMPKVVSTTVGIPNGADEDVASGHLAICSKFDQVEDSSLLQSKPKDESTELLALECCQRSNEMNEQAAIQVEGEISNQTRSLNKKRVVEDLSSHRTSEGEVKTHPILQKSSSSLFTSCSKTSESFFKADGDEHLPLVKRARSRMREPPMEERQLNEAIAQDNLDEKVSSSVIKDKASFSFRDNNYTDLSSQKINNSTDVSSQKRLPSDDCTMLTSNHAIKMCQFKGSSMDAEAALPPSKRLHRALEAMSANAAEARHNSIEAPIIMKTSANDCTDSCSVDHQTHMEKMSVSLEDSDRMQQSDCPDISNCKFGIARSCTSDAQVDPPPVTSSDMDSRKSCLLENRSFLHTNSERTSSSNELSVVSADKNIGTEVVSESDQPCLGKEDKNSIDVSSKNMVTELSTPVVGAIKVLSPKNKECPGSAEGHDTSPQNENLGHKNATLVEVNNTRQDSAMKSGHSGTLPVNSTSVVRPVSPVGLAGGLASGSAKSSSSAAGKNPSINSASQVGLETKRIPTPKDSSFSPDLTPMKVLIAAAQAKRLRSRSSSLADNVSDTRASSEGILSPSPYHRAGSTDRLLSNSEKTDYVSSSRSPDPSLPFRTSAQQMEINDHKSITVPAELQRINKFSRHEADATIKSFEAQLCTLTRAKESISRATRRAIDCAKYDIANEVVGSIVLSLEKEPSLHRRVDMFFLVDSITRSCRGQTGTVGDIFISLFLPVLPRLISAAAPPGSAAVENRRQCLKVLRLWLDRKTFPESIIRHHIRDLESISEPSLNNGFSRRPARTERPLDDPVREMEGMLVDEYGSNTSFHLPGLLASCVSDDDEEGSDADDKIFEAVTPEKPGDTESNVPTEKHKHILEDVDGELEMEDVAPPEILTNTSHDAGGVEKPQHSSYQFGHHASLSFAPPLPEERPPSPPPLPSSPPPAASPCPSACQQPSTSNPLTNLVGTNHHKSTDNNMPPSIIQRPDPQNANIKSELSAYYAPAYRDLSSHLAPPVSSLRSCYYTNNTSSHPSAQSRLDNLPAGSVTSTSNGYFLQPPTAIISNQFSYVQSEPQRSSANSVRFGNDPHSGNCYSNLSPRRPVQHERCRFSSAIPSGPLYPENMEAPSTHLSYYGTSESSPVASQNWSHPPRTSNYAYSGHPSRPPGNSFPQMAEASSHWRLQ